MQQAEHEGRSWWRWMVGGFAIFLLVVVVVAVVVLIYRAGQDRFNLPVTVYVCGSAVDLASVEPGVAPTGCVAVPRGIQLSMDDPDKEANAYTDGFFGFRDVPADSSETTLIAGGAIESSSIGMVSIDKNGPTESGEMQRTTDDSGNAVWTIPFHLSPDLELVSIYIVTSPDSPPNNA